MKFTFGTIVRSFSVVRVKKCILRFISLSINKVFINFFQTWVGFLAILDHKTPIRAGSLWFLMPSSFQGDKANPRTVPVGVGNG